MSDTKTASVRTVFEIIRLALCNGLGISIAVVSVAVSALVSREIGWEGTWATVPYGIQFLSILLVTMPCANLMARFGRKPIFAAATVFGIVGGLVGFWAVRQGDPLFLCLAHALIGVQLANTNFYRFAALEVADERNRASAISLVVFGGTFAAFLGPQLSRWDIFSTVVFESAYLSISALAVAGLLLVAGARIPRPKIPQTKLRLSNIKTAFANPTFTLGLLTAAIGYGLMNLLMIGASISMVICDISYTDISFTVQYHVLAMFVPSLFMGFLIRKLGVWSIIIAGVTLMGVSAVIAATIPFALIGYQAALILLGLSWNMMYVGGSFVIAQSSPPEQSIGLQAVSDTTIGIAAMLGAFLPGLLLEYFGWRNTNFGVIAILLFLFLLILVQKLRTFSKSDDNI
jgi:predicted MFS family arabinose efflux permease